MDTLKTSSKKSLFEEAYIAINRAKDGVGRNNLQTISLPNLNEQEAKAIGAIIAAARAIAIIKAANADIKPLLIDYLRELSSAYSVDKRGNDYAITFSLKLDNLGNVSKRAEKCADSLAAYEIEKELPNIKKSIIMPADNRIDKLIKAMVFEDGTANKNAVGLIAATQSAALVTADILHKMAYAYGHNGHDAVQTILTGVPLDRYSKEYNLDIKPSHQHNGQPAPLQSYPAIVVDKAVYEEMYNNENRAKGRPRA